MKNSKPIIRPHIYLVGNKGSPWRYKEFRIHLPNGEVVHGGFSYADAYKVWEIYAAMTKKSRALQWFKRMFG